ncbi:MAG: hydantoinase B/oxoprolinase family protein [Polaromonas sp.]|uniref:hydantoinase B/oxoprolinase family protein n=1 Tax=Polaromonas sp. TaxID=1869339 RepID=UPI0025F64969|nr:hydantoinase B/oxoprolinase family protein [Polaromonas sp.]MBI2726970.1 hydantoinase B/oxoprolinase family protein [Polaromonas sp.]
MSNTITTKSAIDPITLEIIRNEVQSIPDLVEADLMRTAFSPLIYEYKDYAVGLVDAQGRSVALARQGIPLFLANLIGLAVNDGIATYGAEGIEAGDVIITNHAGTLGQHLNNVVMYTPACTADGKVVAFMAVVGHWIDIGGQYSGSCLGTDTTEVFQEGLQIRTVKLMKKGQRVEEIYRIIEQNTRLPEMLLGDIEAQLTGCMKGRELFESLLARHGEPVLFDAIGEIWRSAEAAARAGVEAIPDGTYEMDSFLDDDGVEIGKRIPVRVAIHIKGSDFTVDFSGVADQLKGPFNSGRYGGAEVCARIAFKYLVVPDEPANEGCFAPVKVVIPPGKFLSAGPTAPFSMYSLPLSTVIDTIIAAMAPVLPERVAAGHHASFSVCSFKGLEPRSGRHFNVFDTAHGGWGGSMHGDGVGPYKTLGHGDNKDIPVEVQEALYPLMIESYAWREGSGGAGKNRGGLGTTKVFSITAPCTASFAFERHFCPPWGLEGGHSGEPGYVDFEKSGGTTEKILKISSLPLAPGDRIHVYSSGGGGYGSPLERPAERVKHDVDLGLVDAADASNIYGVVLDGKQQIDVAATGKKRKVLSQQAR